MYDETPLCCPARATFLTGRHTFHHGVTRNDGRPPATHRRPCAVALHDAGYHTIQAGKYLNDYSGARQPVGWDHVSMVRSLGTATFWRDGEVVRTSPSSWTLPRAQAVDWVRDAPRDQPLFSWVSSAAPHAARTRPAGPCYEPVVMPEDQGAAECAGTQVQATQYKIWSTPQVFPREMPDWPAGWKLRTVCESMLVVDRMVGQLVEAQAERDRPAWFVFLSDNGMSWGQRGSPRSTCRRRPDCPCTSRVPG